jgi:hypothetical protein
VERTAVSGAAPVPDLRVDPNRLGELAGALRAAAGGLDALLAGLSVESGALGTGIVGPAWRHYLELLRRGATPVREDLAGAAERVLDTAAAYAERERRTCEGFHRLGAAMPDPWSPR